MNKTTQYILAAGAVAVVGYLVWKNRKPKQTVSNGGRASGESDGGKDIRKFPRETLSNDIPPMFTVTGGMIGAGTTYTFNAKEGAFYVKSNFVFHCIKAPCNSPIPVEIRKVEYIKAWKNKQKFSKSPTAKDKERIKAECEKQFAYTKLSVAEKNKQIAKCQFSKTIKEFPSIMMAYA